MIKHIIALSMFAIISFGSPAELYKWVDENGKTHYSDKAPESSKKTVILPQNNPAKNARRNAEIKDPIIKPYEIESRKILMTEVIYRWRKQTEISKVKKIGSYYLGDHCSPRGPITVPQVYLHHSEFFPSESGLPRSIKSTAESFGYDVEVIFPKYLVKRLVETDGLNLQVEIVNLDLHSCAPVYKPAAIVSPKKLKARKFKRNRVYLEIKWKLREGRDQNVIYETTTSAFQDDWHQIKLADDVITSAVRQGTANLFADEEFIARITRQSSAGDAITTTGEVVANQTRPELEPGFWSKYLSVFSTNSEQSIQNKLYSNIELKAKLANVFAEIHAIKMQSISFYVSNNYWPRKIGEIGLKDVLFTNHKFISALFLDSSGTISADLKSDVFGPNKMLQLSPDVESYKKGSSMGIEWTCYSNMDISLLPSNCEAL